VECCDVYDGMTAFYNVWTLNCTQQKQKQQKNYFYSCRVSFRLEAGLIERKPIVWKNIPVAVNGQLV